MGVGDGAHKAAASVDQSLKIKTAVDAIQKNHDASQLADLLERCTNPAEKAKLLREIQEAFRQRFGREFVGIEKVQDNSIPGKSVERYKAVSNRWEAQPNDVALLSKIANKIGDQLQVAALSNHLSAKVKIDGLDSWLGNYNVNATSGKLQWIKDWVKEHCGGISIEFTKSGEGLVASLKQGVSQVPGAPLPPIPVGLKREEQKTDAEKAAEQTAAKNKPWYEKAQDTVADKLAPYATAASEKYEKYVPEPVKKAVTAVGNAAAAVGNAIAHPIDTVVAAKDAVVDTVAKAWDNSVDWIEDTAKSAANWLDANVVAPISHGIEAVKEKLFGEGPEKEETPQPAPEKPKLELESSTLETEVDEATGTLIFRDEVTYREPGQETPQAPSKPSIKLPKIPETRRPEEFITQAPLEELPKPLSPTLAPRPLPSVMAVEEPVLPKAASPTPIASQISELSYSPQSNEIYRDIDKLSSSIRDLPITPRPYAELMNASVKKTLDQYSQSFALSSAPAVVGAPMGAETVQEAVALINRAVQEKIISEKKAAEYIEVLRSGMVTFASIQAAEDVLRSLEAAGVPVVKLQAAYSEVNAAKRRLEKQKLAKAEDTSKQAIAA